MERARALVGTGDIDEALRIMAALEKRFPDSGAIPNGMGIALARSGRLDEAIAAFERALSRHELFAEAHYNWAMVAILRAERAGAPPPADALEHLDRALEVDPLYTPAITLRRQVDKGEAIDTP